MDGKNYILLYRQMMQNCLWSDKPFARGQAWIDLLFLANFADGTMICKGVPIEIKRGQVFRTINFLADRWGWGTKKTKNFVRLLETLKMATAEGLPQGTLITIENYDRFQIPGRAEDTTEGTSEGLTTVYTRDYKIIKNNKEEIKKGEIEGEFESLWKLYPRKEGKKDALRHYTAARKQGTTFEEVRDGINAYKEKLSLTGTESKFVKMGSTWFCQHSWEDDYSFGKPEPEKPILSEEARQKIIAAHMGVDEW